MRASLQRWTTKNMWVILGVILVGVALAVAISSSGTDPDTEVAAEPGTGADDGQPTAPAVARRDPDDPLGLGPVDAPVTLVVFSDYQCPFCAAWSDDTLPAMRDYVEAGDLRIEWRDVNIMSDVSHVAASAAYAAGMQGRFDDYHEVLFPDGDTRPASTLNHEDLTTLASETGLDETQFARDMTDPATVDAIAANEAEGQALGVFSTPSFVLGGEPIVGAQPTEVFIDAMERALANGR